MDLMGMRFGRLTVIEYAGTNNKWRRTEWICKCDCGNTIKTLSTNLRRGLTGACGKCRYKIGNQFGHYNLKTYDSAFAIFYRGIKLSARNRGLEFSLSENDVKNLSKKNCYYCGCSPYQVIKVRNRFGFDYIYNGIDRVDNSKGYIIKNVVPCCKKCNQAKMNLTIDEFKSLIVSIYKNWAGV